MEAVTREPTEKLERTPTEAEIAEKLGVSMVRWRRMVIELRTVGMMSATTYAGRDGSVAPEFPAKRDTQPDNMCAHEQLRQVLAIAVKTWPERYQKVVLPVLHQRADHERDRGDHGDQREPCFTDPQNGA